MSQYQNGVVAEAVAVVAAVAVAVVVVAVEIAVGIGHFQGTDRPFRGWILRSRWREVQLCS